MNRSILTAPLAAGLLAAGASAQHDGDIILGVVEGQIATATLVGGELVPECTFGMTLGSGNQANDPGFDSEAGAFSPSSSLGFTLLTALRRWQDGNFDTIPQERVEVSWGPLGPVTTPLDDTPVDGFMLGVSDNGEFHSHYTFELTSPAAPGVYLLTMQIWSTQSGLAPTEPIFLLINQKSSQETVDEATQWWRDHGAWCSAQSCVADFNGDGAVDTRDVLAFLNAWSAGGSAADMNGDGVVDTRDVIAYLNLWTAGC